MNATEFAYSINSSWQKTVTGILVTADLCAQADSALKGAPRADLLDQLCFSAATFSKLVTIGRCEQLRSASVTPLLPSSYSIVYEIAQLTPPELKRAIDDKIINPDLTRNALLAWKRENQPVSPPASERVMGSIIVDRAIDDEQVALTLPPEGTRS